MALSVGTINLPGEVTIYVAGVYHGTATFDLPIEVDGSTTPDDIRRAVAAAMHASADKIDGAPLPTGQPIVGPITVDSLPVTVEKPMLPSEIMRAAGIAQPERYDLVFIVGDAFTRAVPEAPFMPVPGTMFITARKATD